MKSVSITSNVVHERARRVLAAVGAGLAGFLFGGMLPHSTAVGLVAWLALVCVAFVSLVFAVRSVGYRTHVMRLGRQLNDKEERLSMLLQNNRELKSELEKSLTVDIATGLPNRLNFVERLQEKLKAARSTGSGSVLVAVIRFWQLEEVSHSMGSTFSERLLIEAADRLNRAMPVDCHPSHTGDRDLALLFDIKGDEHEPAEIARLVLEIFRERFEIGHRVLVAPVVIGFAASPDGFDYGQDLLAKASLAANAAIGDEVPWSSFKLSARNEKVRMLQFEADLHAAVENNDLRLHFQPIISVSEGRIVGFESLLRWRYDGGSWIPPEKFIQVAESIGQMQRITEWVSTQCILQSGAWMREFEGPPYLTFNLTPRDLSRTFCDHMLDALAASGIPFERIRVEVTENALVKDFRAAARLIGDLNDRGVGVLLDDFGTGYSSLSYLRDLPFSAVKIDKSFIQRMTTEARDMGLVRSVVSLVHYLGMECVAEGVETQEQLDLVEMIDCDYWQGYLFSRPMPVYDAERLISMQSRRRSGTEGRGP